MCYRPHYISNNKQNHSLLSFVPVGKEMMVSKMAALHPVSLTVHRVSLCSDSWLMYNESHMAFPDPSLYFGGTSICVDPTNELQLVIKQAQKTGVVWLFPHELIFARQIFPPETVYNAFFYLLSAQGTSVRTFASL